MRLVPEDRMKLATVEPHWHMPEITHFPQLAHQRHKGRGRADEPPWHGPDRQARSGKDGANGISDLDTSFETVSLEMKHLEGGEACVALCKPRHCLSGIGQIR